MALIDHTGCYRKMRQIMHVNRGMIIPAANAMSDHFDRWFSIALLIRLPGRIEVENPCT